MKTTLVYVYPHLGPSHDALARRFVESCLRFPAVGIQFLIVVNGGDFNNRHYEEIFHPLDCLFLKNDNAGYDIGAFQVAAQAIGKSADLMIFCGSSTYIRRPDWATRIRDSFKKHGDTLFGVMGHRGGSVSPHIRTTGFWMTPRLMNSYPYWINAAEHRYGFEHGVNCLTSWVIANGKTPLVVSATGEYPMALWDRVPGGYHVNDQSGLLMGDRLSRPPHHYCE